MQYQCKLVAKWSWRKCPCMSNDEFIVLVSGVVASSLRQHVHSCITSPAGFFDETSNHPGDSALLQPRSGTLWLLAFPKTKITFEREEIPDCQWDSEKYNRAADGDWENWVRSQGAYFEGDWGVIVLCTVFLVSSSINVSIFQITWLAFWTDLVFSPQ